MDGKTPESLTCDQDPTCVGEPAPIHQHSSFRKPTPHFPDGRNVARALRWDQSQRFSRPDPVWSRSGSRQRLAVQLGVEDTKRRKDTFPAQQACEIPSPAVECGHTRPAERFGSRESLLHRLRHQLKTANFSRFSSLLQAFSYYDRGGKGSIDLEDLRAACRCFQLPVRGSVLEDLMDYCDADGDGLIGFVEFANFLSWKDMMPISREEERVLTQECQSSTASAGREETQPPPPAPPPPLPHHPRQALLRPDDLEPLNPAGSLKSVRTLVKPQAEPDPFKTTSSAIGCSLQPSASSPGSAPSAGSSTYGVLAAPGLKWTGDGTDCGHTATAAGLLHPSVYHLHGVDEEQLLRPRSRKELSQIFRKVGVDLPEETFEKVWTLAAAEHKAGEVCVESFSRALKEIKAQ